MMRRAKDAPAPTCMTAASSDGALAPTGQASGPRRRPRARPPRSWQLLAALAWLGCLGALATTPAAARPPHPGTEISFGPDAAEFHAVLYGAPSCPAGSPHLGEWWRAVQSEELAPRVRLTYRSAPKTSSKKTAVATRAALASMATAGDTPAAFFGMMAAICDLVRAESAKSVTDKRTTQLAADLGLPKKEFRKNLKRLKKQAKKNTVLDELYASRHFARAGAAVVEVNDVPVEFTTADEFKAWLARQEPTTVATEVHKPGQVPGQGKKPEPLPVLQVAVYDIASSAVGDVVSFVVRDALTAELRKLDRVSVISMDEVRVMLSYEANKSTVGCDADSCISEIAEALGVDVVVTGALSAVGDKSYLTLKRMEQKQGTVGRQFSKTLSPAGGEEFLSVLGEAVSELFPDRDLRDGQARGVDTALTSRLNPPPLPPAVFWTGLSLTGTALALSAFSGAAALSSYQQFDALRSASAGSTIDGRRLGTLKVETSQWQDLARMGLLTTGALVSVTSIIAAFTHWDSDPTEAAGRTP